MAKGACTVHRSRACHPSSRNLERQFKSARPADQDLKKRGPLIILARCHRTTRHSPPLPRVQCTNDAVTRYHGQRHCMPALPVRLCAVSPSVPVPQQILLHMRRIRHSCLNCNNWNLLSAPRLYKPEPCLLHGRKPRSPAVSDHTSECCHGCYQLLRQRHRGQGCLASEVNAFDIRDAFQAAHAVVDHWRDDGHIQRLCGTLEPSMMMGRRFAAPCLAAGLVPSHARWVRWAWNTCWILPLLRCCLIVCWMSVSTHLQRHAHALGKVFALVQNSVMPRP